MRRKTNMGIQLKELETDTPPVVPSKLSPSKGKIVRRDEPGKKLHNETEKSRRNLLKHDYERLRSVVPCNHDVQKQTTLALLHQARVYIRNLEAKDKKYQKFKLELIREQKYLKRRLDQMQHLVNGGAIGLGNTLLISEFQNPDSLPLVHLRYDPPSVDANTPPILKRKQVLLTATTSQPQIVITSVASKNIVYPESMCLMIDEMEHLEGVPELQIPYPKKDDDEESIPGELIETEVIEAFSDD